MGGGGGNSGAARRRRGETDTIQGAVGIKEGGMNPRQVSWMVQLDDKIGSRN